MPTVSWAPPTPTTGNVIVGMATVWTSLVGTALPSDSNLGVGTAWTTAGWAYVGATDQGVSLNSNPSTVDIRIEEQSTPVMTLTDTQTFQVSWDFSEETLNNIKIAMGNSGTIAVTAAGAGQPGKQVLSLSNSISQMSCALLTQNQQGFPRVLSIPSVMSSGTVSTSFRRAASQRLYPTTLSSTCAYSSIQWIDIVAAATS